VSFPSAVSLSALSPCQNVSSTVSDASSSASTGHSASSSNGIVVVGGGGSVVEGGRVSSGASVSPGARVSAGRQRRRRFDGQGGRRFVAGVEDRLAVPTRRHEDAGRDDDERPLHPLTAPDVRPAHELALEHEEHDGDRDGGDDGGGHHEVRLVECRGTQQA
jgi:hypothetical protein